MKKSEKRGFVWWALRISFFTMISFLVITYPLLLLAVLPGGQILLYILGFIFVISIPFTFIISIIHLIKYKNKIFAIIALVASILFILSIIYFYIQFRGFY